MKSFSYKNCKPFCFQLLKVLYFCVGFRDLSHAEKKITVVTSWATDKMFHSKRQLRPFWLKWMSFYAFAQLVTTFIFFSTSDKSLNGTTAMNQHKCRGPLSAHVWTLSKHHRHFFSYSNLNTAVYYYYFIEDKKKFHSLINNQ